MKINLIDPGLSHKAGHHHDIDLRIASELINLGHEITIYSNLKYIQDEKLSKGIKIVPIFSISPYINLKQDRITGELDDFIHYSNVYSQELKKISPADMLIVPTMFSFLLNAFAIAKIKTPISACILFGPDFCNVSNGKLRWSLAFRNSKDFLVINIGSLEKINFYDYLPLTFNKKFNIFPLPYDGSLPHEEKNKIETVGFFGHQRGEKGMDLLQPLINFLIAKNINIIFHDSSGYIKFDHPNVNCLGFVENLTNEISKCDLIILPYLQEEYSHRGSGILYEALASGVPALVPFNTTLAEHIEESGSGIMFFDHTAESIIEAFNIAEARYKDISTNASIVSKKWSQKHGIKNFVKSFIEESNFYKC
jgi:glycosyltransferase involved in cell wall biosynthesis